MKCNCPWPGLQIVLQMVRNWNAARLPAPAPPTPPSPLCCLASPRPRLLSRRWWQEGIAPRRCRGASVETHGKGEAEKDTKPRFWFGLSQGLAVASPARAASQSFTPRPACLVTFIILYIYKHQGSQLY